MKISGSATSEGTLRFAKRFTPAAEEFFRAAQGWMLSSLGMGTYHGEDDDETDADYRVAMTQALRLGCNVFDTAVPYRHQRSERVIGQTLSRLIDEGDIRRDEVVISSKAGFVPFDSAYHGEVREYFKETFFKSGIITPAELVSPGHCLSPAFLQQQIETSRSNLACGTIDIYYLHNPETQLAAVGRKEFAGRIRRAFEVLESNVAAGKIVIYGVATWEGFRVAPGSINYLSLSDLYRTAEEVGGKDHHFRAVMLPLNLAMPEGLMLANQKIPRRKGYASLLRVAQELGLIVAASSSLHQGRLAQGLSVQVRAAVSGHLNSDAQRALQFARTAQGVTVALVGMRRLAHVEQNLSLARVSRDTAMVNPALSRQMISRREKRNPV